MIVKKVYISEILSYLGTKVIDTVNMQDGLFIDNLAESSRVNLTTLDWINPSKTDKQQIAEASPARIILVDPTVESVPNKTLIVVENPKIALAEIGNHFFVDTPASSIHPTALIHSEANVGEGCTIGPYAVIGKATIGSKCVIEGHVHISDSVVMGEGCVIKAGSVLGGAGITAVISKGKQYGRSYFSMNTDGSNIESVILPAGGSRIPSSVETLKMKNCEDGSVRSLEQVIMVGPDVFSFAISELPRDIKRLLEYAGKSIDEIDKYAFHQANDFMTNYIVKKAKANPDKLLHSIQKYGNTAGTSIPLCMVENRSIINQNDSILMNAIGAGFAFGTVLLNIANCNILPLQEL